MQFITPYVQTLVLANIMPKTLFRPSGADISGIRERTSVWNTEANYRLSAGMHAWSRGEKYFWMTQWTGMDRATNPKANEQ